MNTTNPRTPFFDGLAAQWDGRQDLAALEAQLARDLAGMGVASGEAVVDVGCGTGNLVKALLRVVGPHGRVLALDISPEMLRVAREKNPDERVTWHLGDALVLPLDDGRVDRIFYMCVWPHLEARREVVLEARRVLRPGGRLHVWHLISRSRVNDIHASACEAVRRDHLPPATETAKLLEEGGFTVSQVVDDERYLVSAVRPPER